MKKNNKLPITTRIRFWIIMQLLPVRLRTDFIKHFFTERDKFLIARGLELLEQDRKQTMLLLSGQKYYNAEMHKKDISEIKQIHKAFNTGNGW